MKTPVGGLGQPCARRAAPPEVRGPPRHTRRGRSGEPLPLFSGGLDPARLTIGWARRPAGQAPITAVCLLCPTAPEMERLRERWFERWCSRMGSHERLPRPAPGRARCLVSG
ncbi:hypothetical protein NDU88_009272 [Pleurodeles waltl]|uniref:Uncharacterized protein n=1 Tax=Pleurodeles waltl TaxID=8319 RepID=A0AAV7RZX9_PLEWA|nr:hypothetical protein NDU88_009272 [Pleurodeles waltl]